MERKILLTLVFYISYISIAQTQNLQWTKSCSYSDETVGRSVHADQNENLYVGGYFNASTHGTGPNGVFISKYDKLGNLIWSDTTCSPMLTLEGMWTDKYGNSYLLVNLGTNTKFGSFNISFISPYYNTVLVKYDSAGIVQWANQIKASFAKAIVGDNAGNIYVTAEAIDSTNIGGLNVPIGMYLAKYNSSGTSVWIKHTGTAPGSFVLTYNNANEISLGKRVGNTNVISRYDLNGNLISNWAPGFTPGLMSADKNGNLYVSGTFYYSITLGATTLTDSAQAMYIAKVNASNQFIWARKISSNNFISSFVDTTGGVFISASYGSYQNGGISTIKYDTTGSFQWAYSYPSNGSNGWIHSDGKGNILTVSWQYAPMKGIEMILLKIKDIQMLPTFINTAINNDYSNIYPNPTNGLITIKVNSPEQKVMVYSPLGALVCAKQLTVGINEIDLSNQAKGIYFIELITKSERINKKIVVN